VKLSAGPEPRDEDKVLNLHTFGMGAIESEWPEQPANDGSTPKWRWRFLPSYDDDGQLFIGIADLTPPQTLSLLFQMAEGSANPDRLPASVRWSCLCGGQWKPLGSEKIRMDTTQGLLNSGIVQLSLPADASATHTRMPSGLHWLRASVRRFSDSLSDTIAIHTQAVRATGISQQADPTRPFRPLPAGSIGEPAERLPGLKTMLQPYTSFNGKPGEQASGFYLRASERLRHKQRALTLWDYERLVLEHFPDIYRAKALAADLLDPGAEPGAVTLVLIPDIREKRPFNPFEPKVPQARLQEIRDFLQRLAPPFARIRTQNPRFDYVGIRVGVRFQDMDNFDFYADRLQRELQQYLTPWAFDHAAEISFGREIYLSVLVHFIESLPYVNYIDQPALTLLERRESDGRIMPVQDGLSWNKTEGHLQLRAPDILLVSAPRHSIEPLAESTEALQHLRQGVGYAKIELDFKIKPGA